MNLTALRYFVAVVEAGSIREASEGLHVAQSAVSRQIQSLEQSLGSLLLTRLPRGIEPTLAGQVLLRHAREGLATLAQAQDDITALRGLRRGEIRIATIEPFATEVLADLMTHFQARHAEITFDVRVGHTRQVLGLVQEGIAEIGIAYNPPLDPGLVILQQWDEPLMGFVAPWHPLASRQSIALCDLAEHPLILPPSRSPTRQLIDEAAREAKLALRIQTESDSVGLRLAIAQRTSGVAVLARLSGCASIRHGSVHAILITDPALRTGHIAAMAHRRRERTRAARDFFRLLQSHRPSLSASRW